MLAADLRRHPGFGILGIPSSALQDNMDSTDDDDKFTPTKHLTPPPHHSSSRPAAAHTKNGDTRAAPKKRVGPVDGPPQPIWPIVGPPKRRICGVCWTGQGWMLRPRDVQPQRCPRLPPRPGPPAGDACVRHGARRSGKFI